MLRICVEILYDVKIQDWVRLRNPIGQIKFQRIKIYWTICNKMKIHIDDKNDCQWYLNLHWWKIYRLKASRSNTNSKLQLCNLNFITLTFNWLIIIVRRKGCWANTIPIGRKNNTKQNMMSWKHFIKIEFKCIYENTHEILRNLWIGKVLNNCQIDQKNIWIITLILAD